MSAKNTTQQLCFACSCLAKKKSNVIVGSSCINVPSLSEQEQRNLSQISQSFALSNGFVFRKTPELNWEGDNGVNVGVLPHTLYPQPFSRDLFRNMQKHTFLLSQVIDRMSRDTEFLEQSLYKCAQVGDIEFTGKLLQLSKRTKSKQLLHLGIFRNDFMMHYDEESESIIPQQVEVNTVVTGATVMSAIAQRIHQYLLRKSETLRSHFQDTYGNNTVSEVGASLEGITSAMKLAHEEFAKQQNTEAHCILFVVQPLEKIKFLIDQIGIEQILEEKHNISVIRMTLLEVLERCSLEENTGNLLIDGKRRVSIVYFRAGFTPKDFPSTAEWDARELLEQSTAIKAPTINIQLLGTKKMQQVMAQPAVLERYVTSDEAQFLRSYFTGLYSLSLPEHQQFIAHAIENYEDYVLKPQREGGGDLIHGVALREMLLNLTDEICETFILMKKIKPLPFDTHSVKRGVVHYEKSTFELGVYGFYLGDGKQVQLNNVSGYLLRTKQADSAEGGLAIGISSLDSIILVE
jgi:glutathione synthetase